ncbi:MAG: STAS domain-containing protein [Pirellulaceae bacterium]
MEIKLLRRSDEGFERFDVFGDITASNWAQHAVEPFVVQYGEDVYSKQVLLNMSKTHHVDSTGIEWLLTNHKRFSQQGGKLVLHSLTPATQRLFHMMRMHLVLHIAPNEESAKSLLTKDPA